mgnify:CR=1 FL=1
MVGEYFSKAGQLEGDAQDEMLKKAELSTKLIIKLKSTRFKTDIMTECRYMFYDPDFNNKLNEQQK